MHCFKSELVKNAMLLQVGTVRCIDFELSSLKGELDIKWLASELRLAKQILNSMMETKYFLFMYLFSPILSQY